MKKVPIVSIVMPLYNKRPYVRRAIESVQQQTFIDWELIIIDDGSNDSSTTEIPMDDKRIRLIQQQNAGPAAARNRGIGEGRGEFVTFIDADDYYYPQKLEKEAELLHTQKKAEWMLSAFDVVRANEVRGRRLRDIHGRELKSEVVLHNAPNQLSIPGAPIDGLCIKRRFLEELKGFNEKMRCFEIAELITRCTLKQPRVLVYPDPLYRVVKVPDSAYTVLSHRIEGMRQFGESLYNLSTYYPQYSKTLTSKSKQCLNSHVHQLIQFGRKNEARRYLRDQFPYPRDRTWWKLWIASWQPEWLIQRRMAARNN